MNTYNGGSVTPNKGRIVPRETFVLIAPDKVVISDIIEIPENNDMNQEARGTVIAVGPKCHFVREGDTVYFETFDWTQVGEGQIILGEGEILAREAREDAREGR